MTEEPRGLYGAAQDGRLIKEHFAQLPNLVFASLFDTILSIARQSDSN